MFVKYSGKIEEIEQQNFSGFSRWCLQICWTTQLCDQRFTYSTNSMTDFLLPTSFAITAGMAGVVTEVDKRAHAI